MLIVLRAREPRLSCRSNCGGFSGRERLTFDRFENLIAAARVDRRICREEHTDLCAVVRIASVAGDANGASVFVNDAAANPEAEAGAILTLGGEKGLEQVWLHIFWNSGAIVGDRHSCARWQLLTTSIDACSLWCDADLYLATLSGRLGCIRDEVGEDLSQLSRESRYFNRLRHIG